jgi:peptide chain release factor 2
VFGGLFDPDRREAELARLDAVMADPGFWQNPGRAQHVLKQARVLRGPLVEYQELSRRVGEWFELKTLAVQDFDEAVMGELAREAEDLKRELEALELQLILTGPYDAEDALLSLHAGTGGTDAQDWTEMLLRMYLRWAERHGFETAILDMLPGEEAGLKSVTVAVKGDNAYGFLRGEQGVHRLVRISPFDASGRRHTSFASVEVLPDLGETDAIEIRPEDLKVETFRASGAGGQHVNKTESAVRITHLPTGIVVSCQNERSQHANRETAMRMLRAKLAERQEQERRRQLAALKGEQLEIGWGSQIRSYVLQPYTTVKDHRTRVEVGNVQAVMDGDLDPFIQAYLQAEARGALRWEPEAEDVR